MPLALIGMLWVLGCHEATAPAVRDNLVVNGGFEYPRVGHAEYLSFTAGDPFAAWSIDSGAVDLLSAPIWRPADGSQSLDMDGSCGTGVIHQDLETEPGVSYDLHFALAGNPNGGPAVKRLEVSWGDAVVDTVEFDSSSGSKGDPGWTDRGYTLIAPGSTTRLTFRSLSPGCYGALLDAVSVRRTPTI